MEMFRHALAPDELRRAERFRFAPDKRRFIISRGILRIILGGYLNMKPDKIRFRRGPFGKPELEGNAGLETLCFSASRSNGLALYAFAAGRQIGVDLEYIRPNFRIGDMARQFLPPEYNALLEACPEHDRGKTFFALWCRNEAYLKAQGTGLAGAPLKPDGQWSFIDLHVGRGYAACLAVKGQGTALKRRRWTGCPPGM